MNSQLHASTYSIGVKAGAGPGTTSTYTTTAAVDGIIRGKRTTQFSVKTNQATPTTDVVTGVAFPALAINKGTVLAWGFNAAGTVKLAQGSVEDLDDQGNFKNAPNFPYLPSDFCPFAYTILKNGASGSAFTVGSSSWDATGMTDTWVDISALPDRPQVS